MAASRPNSDRQRESTHGDSVDGRQLSLGITPRAPESQPVRPEVVYARPTLLHALRLAQDISGLEDKQVGGALAIDKGQWSRIKSGDAHFPTNLYGRFMDVVGNEIPLLWLANSRGYELQPKLSALEAQLAAERAAREEAERENALLKRLFAETRR